MVLVIGGWYDYFLRGTVRAFRGLQAPKRLAIGNWGLRGAKIGVRPANQPCSGTRTISSAPGESADAAGTGLVSVVRAAAGG